MDLNSRLAQCPVIAILRGITTAEVEPVFLALESAGICIAEIPLNSPDPFASIGLAAERFGGRMLIGAGTVVELNDVEKVAAAGGELIVTPHADATIVEEAKRRGMIAIPGFSTTTEAFAMLRAGADAIKLFPAEVGGAALLKAMRAVLPRDTKVIPVGGVDRLSMATWKQAGAAGYGIGSALYKPGDTASEVKNKALAFVDVCRGLA
jgi:2-dehydro-3-deoxyphosphogalactonate aldolase